MLHVTASCPIGTMTKAEEEQEPNLLDGLITAADLDGMVFAPLVEHIPSLIAEGFGILAGSPKIGKSWLAASIGLAVAQGGMALGGIKVKPRRVLLLALEDGNRRLQKRMQFLNYEEPLPERLSILTKVKPLLVVATISEWLLLHQDDEPLIILDTLGKARPQRRSGEDAYIADYQFGSLMKEIADSTPGAALLAVHHTRKTAADDWLETVGGSQGITGSADYVLVLTRKRKSDEGMLSVTGRDILENEYSMCVDQGRWRIDGSDLDIAAERAEARRETDGLADRSIEVLLFVNGRVETRAADLVELSIDPKQAAVYLGRLAKSGRINKLGRGVYTPVGSVGSVENEP